MRRLTMCCLLFSFVVNAAEYSNAQQKPPPKDAIKVFIEDMHCENCAKRVRSRIFTVKGVQRVTTFVKQNVAIVEATAGQSVSPRALWEAMEKGKFAMDRIETPETTFDKKPES